MRFPLTEQLIDEARRFELRSACRDCLFWRESKPGGPGASSGREAAARIRGNSQEPPEAASTGNHEGACLHGWPDDGQRRWPLDAVDPATGAVPTHAAFCKEFELR